MRKAFVRALSEEAKKNKKIILLTGDLGFNVLEEFRDLFPERFLNLGVAEANLVTVAAGLATTGYIPFVYSIATFMSMRPFEQIRSDVSLQNLNVKIVGVGGGLSYTKAGPTHHSMEDISLMRNLSNMTILAPFDQDETYTATKRMVKHKGPVYLRVGRNPDQTLKNVKEKFEIGKARQLISGSKVAICFTGSQISQSLEVVKILKQKGIDPSLYSFSTIQPIDKKNLSLIAKNHPFIFTVEEHRVSGGFGTAVLEELNKMNFTKNIFTPFGLSNSFTSISSEYENLLKLNNMMPNQIARVILSHINKK